VFLWDLRGGSLIRSWESHQERVWAVAVDDYNIVSASLVGGAEGGRACGNTAGARMWALSWPVYGLNSRKPELHATANKPDLLPLESAVMS
jgi:hypothetical protein